MKILYKQCNLQNGASHITAWLEADKVKVGFKVTLKDSEEPEKWWTITSVGDTTLPKAEIKGSHNSKSWHDKDFHGKLKGLIKI